METLLRLWDQHEEDERGREIVRLGLAGLTPPILPFSSPYFPTSASTPFSSSIELSVLTIPELNGDIQ